MTNAYTDYETPQWLQEPEYTPAELWERQVRTQAPYWQTRAPMRQLGQRLQARYALGGGSPAFQETQRGDEALTFADYISGYTGGPTGGFEAASYQELLDRARLAAAATRQDYGQYLAGFAPASPEWREAAWYGDEFGPGEGREVIGAQQIKNQLAAATLLAQQRQGGGLPYTGAMGSAIANAVAAQQQYREDIGQPKGSFLDWYTSQLT